MKKIWIAKHIKDWCAQKQATTGFMNDCKRRLRHTASEEDDEVHKRMVAHHGKHGDACTLPATTRHEKKKLDGEIKNWIATHV